MSVKYVNRACSLKALLHSYKCIYSKLQIALLEIMDIFFDFMDNNTMRELNLILEQYCDGLWIIIIEKIRLSGKRKVIFTLRRRKFILSHNG